MEDKVLFTGDKNDPTTLKAVLGVGCGAVSVCWSDVDKAGDFQSDIASVVLDEMLSWIEEHYELKDEYK